MLLFYEKAQKKKYSILFDSSKAINCSFQKITTGFHDVADFGQKAMVSVAGRGIAPRLWWGLPNDN